MDKVVVALSGGLDSTVLATDLQKRCAKHLVLVNFQYGSKHGMYEGDAANYIAAWLGHSDLVKFDLEEVFAHFNSALLRGPSPIPEGHYEAESMRQTVVPGRNLILLSILAGYAQSIGAKEVALGIHAGDHFIYPDCRPEFYLAARRAISLSSDGTVGLDAPFLHHKKDQIVALGLQFQVPFEYTRTCYKRQPRACGKCGSCQERLSAFAANGIADPLDYEVRELLPK